MSVRTLAIIGGGPAGAFAASELARSGRDVLLFEEKLAWEKPCGGGVTPKAVERWPFLSDTLIERNWVTACEMVAPSGRKTRFQLNSQIAIFSRLTLNGLMLQRARELGASVIRQRITDIQGGPGNWTLVSPSAEYKTGFVALAAGARCALRSRFAPLLGPENFVLAQGYYVPGTHRTIQIRFLPELHGYIWLFPRANHFSIGICGRMAGKNSSDLRKVLEGCIRNEFRLSLEGAQFYAHIIPALTKDALRNLALSGEGWAMLGDSAGLVDAITGEGLFYALRSAELFCQAMLAETPREYASLATQEILPELEFAAGIADRFYSGKWLGSSVIERMISLTNRSSNFRDLMRDLFSGAQEYHGLRRRVRRSLPRIAAEALANTFGSTRDKLEPISGRERVSL